jgi:tetratricopeptide (TPR) repeat protein
MRGDFMLSRLHLRAIVFGLLCCFSLLPFANAQKVKLTRAKVEQLIQNQAPDEAIAKEIQDRGLSFPLDRKAVEGFAAKGAGPLTLAALREQIREGEVEVRDTEPGSQMLLDGKEAGNADAVGFFAVRQVPEGNHELIAKKGGYGDAHVQFTLTNKEQKQLSLPLDWLGGYLSVSVLPWAAIQVTGPLSFKGGATGLKCPTGSYTVSASLEGYIAQTRTFQVGAGEHHAERLQLEVDPAFVARLMADAKAKFSAGDSSGAIEPARKLLKLTPGNAKAAEILAEASFQTGDFESFEAAGITAIRAGGEVTVPLMHVHYGIEGHDMAHDVTLTLDRSGLTFKSASVVNGCVLEGFRRPYDEISSVANIRGEFLNLQFITPKKGGGFVASKHDDFNFLPSGSKIGKNYLNFSRNATQALSSVEVLIKAAAAQPEPARSSQQGVGATEGTTPSASVACADYDSCFTEGNKRLFHDEDRSSAIPYFEHALGFRKDQAGWIYLGTAYLRAGRPADVSTAWDEFLKIKKQIGMPVCRSNGFDECESGMLLLGPKNVTWQVAGRTVFDVPATKLKVIGNEDHQSEGYISLGLEVDGTKYDFEFVTVGVPLTKGSKHAFTDAQGMAQQWTVGDYISQTIKKLAAGGY